jgi:hypothetical protein
MTIECREFVNILEMDEYDRVIYLFNYNIKQCIGF